MDSDNTQKVLLVTGTSKGIGRYIAEYFCSKDYKVIGCSRTATDLEHANYEHVTIDVAKEADIILLIRHIRQVYKRLDVLINNAAINPAILSAALLPYDTIEKTFKVNVYAPMILCREAVKLMGRHKSGRIINLGSMASKHEVSGEALYTATKSAMIAYSRVLAKEVAKLGITVNVVSPAAIKTDLSAKINQQALMEVLSRNAITDYGETNDVTNTIEFLLKPESKSVTGQVIYLGGA